jgi:hypothetical protein
MLSRARTARGALEHANAFLDAALSEEELAVVRLRLAVIGCGSQLQIALGFGGAAEGFQRQAHSTPDAVGIGLVRQSRFEGSERLLVAAERIIGAAEIVTSEIFAGIDLAGAPEACFRDVELLLRGVGHTQPFECRGAAWLLAERGQKALFRFGPVAAAERRLTAFKRIRGGGRRGGEAE